MATRQQKPRLETLIVALPETAGSALCGLVDVLTSTGLVWQTLTRTEPVGLPFHVRIASMGTRTFRCGNGIPVSPNVSIRDNPPAGRPATVPAARQTAAAPGRRGSRHRALADETLPREPRRGWRRQAFARGGAHL
jgi:hypothetical protein